jgi:hypothetical protein
MDTLPALRHEVWERTPPEAQAHIRALEARVETLTSMRMVKKLMRLRARSISGVPRAVPDTAWDLYILGLG